MVEICWAKAAQKFDSNKIGVLTTKSKTSANNKLSTDVNNLYVVDGSFFPSNAGVSPALTIIANALRVGDRLISRLH